MKKLINYKYKGFFNTLDIIRRKIRIFFGHYYYFIARCRGVTFLGSCTFIGRPKFKLHPGAKIIIGDHCEFLSGHTDNLIGINHPCIITAFNAGVEIRIGENSGFSGTVMAAFAGITIGHHVKCGANTLISDSDWHPEDPRSGSPKPIVIGDHVWLGINSVVLKGVSIGENSVIGANSVVAKSIPANVIAAGNPCKVIRNI
ncbi:MAG TPA: DapH/DapD/GlmU-related protein [Puia sp.]|nr:DapH/DapD/GlmU-related protein [Puia sp.]